MSCTSSSLPPPPPLGWPGARVQRGIAAPPRVSETAAKWLRKLIQCLDPSLDGLVQQEAALGAAALASAGTAHRSALLAGGVVPALAACLQAAGSDHTVSEA